MDLKKGQIFTIFNIFQAGIKLSEQGVYNTTQDAIEARVFFFLPSVTIFEKVFPYL